MEGTSKVMDSVIVKNRTQMAWLYPSFLKHISCRQHIDESCFLKIHSDNLFLLIEVFGPLTFNVIIDVVGFQSAILIFLLFLLSINALCFMLSIFPFMPSFG